MGRRFRRCRSPSSIRSSPARVGLLKTHATAANHAPHRNGDAYVARGRVRLESHGRPDRAVPPFVNSNGGLRRSDSQNLLYVEEIFLDGEEPVLSVEEILLSVEERLFHVEEVLQDGKTRPPLRREASPLRKGAAPLRRAASPLRRGAAPRRRGGTPLGRGKSSLRRGGASSRRGEASTARGLRVRRASRSSAARGPASLRKRCATFGGGGARPGVGSSRRSCRRRQKP